MTPIRAADISHLLSPVSKTRDISSKCQHAQIITRSPYKKKTELSQKDNEAAQRKAQINVQKQKQKEAKKEKKPSSTQEAKTGMFHGKIPALSTRCYHFKKRLCDEEDEITVELGGTDDSQPLSRDVEDNECIFCTGLFSEDNDGEN
jgi:hypothetical protein